MSRVLMNKNPKEVISWFCPLCGGDVSETAVSCTHCNARFAPVHNSSEEEAKVVETQKKIQDALDKDAEEKKKKSQTEVVVEKKIVTTEYVPRSGTRIAFIYDWLKDGVALNTLIKEFAVYFDQTEAVAAGNVKSMISELKKVRNLPIVEKDGTYKLERKEQCSEV